MFRAPSSAGLPHLLTMLDDIRATPKQISALLGIQPSTLAHYKRAAQAPKPIMSAADCEARRFGDTYRDLAKSYERKNVIFLTQIKLLKDELARMARESSAPGAANGPIYRIA